MEAQGADSPSVGRPVAARGSGAGQKGLRSNALGLFSSLAIGLASTAPAYSLAATLGLIVAGVGLQAPVVTVLAFVPMLFIAIAYKELNRVDPDCGTTFAWAARAFGPRTGWMGGWGIIIADVIVMANLAQIAGTYGFRLVGFPGLASNTLWTTTAGVVWIIVMTGICYVGVEVSATLQRWLLCVELAMLLVFSITALVKSYGSAAPATAIHVSAGWFDPFRISSPGAFTAGMLSAIFIYWGWDTAVSVNEETADKERTPGRAAVMSTVLLLIIYVLVTTSAQSFAGVGSTGVGLANPDNSGDVLSGLGDAVFGTNGAGWLFSKLLIFLVLTSAAASTQTTILPTARTTFSMAVHRAIPSNFARIHRRFQTPSTSTVAMGLVSIAFYVLLTRISTHVLSDSIASVGLGIAFYYGLTGVACPWYFRRVLKGSKRDLWMRGVLPGLGGAMLFGFFCYAVFDVYADPGYGSTSVTLPLLGRVGGVSVIGVGSLLLGVVLMLVQAAINKSWFTHPDVPRSAAANDTEAADATATVAAVADGEGSGEIGRH